MAIDFQADDDKKVDFQLDFQPDDEPGMSGKLLGLGEGALSTASGILSAVPTGLRTLGELAATGNLDEALSRSESTSNAATYTPRTEQGKKVANSINEVLHDYSKEVEDKFSGDVTYLNQQKEKRGEQLNAGDYAAENTERFVGNLIGNMYVPGIPLPRKGAPRTDVNAEALKNLEKPAAKIDFTPEDFAKAHDNYIVDQLTQLDRQVTQNEIRAAVEKMKDEQLQQSRQDLADYVARAEAERAKEVDAGVVDKVQRADDIASGLEDREARLQNEDLATKLKEWEANRGKEPIYVDPQGQAFRGDPGEGMARLGLERQTDAMERDLTHLRGQMLKEGEPLALLVDPLRKPTEALDKYTPDTNREYGPINSNAKGGKQRGAQTILNDLAEKVVGAFRGIEEALSRIDIPNKQAIDAYPVMRELYEKTGNPDVISFARKELRSLGYPSDVLAEFDKAIIAAHQKKLAETEAKVLQFRPRNQRGGVTTDLLTLGMLPKKNPIAKMTKQKDGSFIPDDPTPEHLNQLMDKARAEEDGKSAKYMDSGAQLTAMKRGSTAIDTVGTLIKNADKRAEKAIREQVFPAERALRELSTEELKSLGQVFKMEMFKGARFGREKLSMFSPKVQNAYRMMREMFDESLKIQNAAREAKGQKPVTPMEAYLSSRWQGDFRRPLYDANGKLVWYLAADTKMGLDAQTRAVLAEHPDLTFDPKKDHTVRFWNRKTDLESAYTTMLDILGRDDPAVEKIQQFMESQTVGRGATFLNQEKHFKNKGNIRGFIGDRPELTLADYTDRNIPLLDKVKVKGEKSEVLDMFQQQVQYAKNGIRWSELQKAGQSIKKIINDPYLVEHQPNNVEYIRQYFKHAIGYGESRFTRAMSDSIRDFGISPALFDRAVGGLKSYFILSKLAANVGYITAQGIQISMMLPHMVDTMVKGRFVSNPVKAIASGLLGGLTMGTGHMFNASTGGKRFEGIPGADFFNSAYKYAEDNGLTARSIYDESPIASSFSATAKVGNALSKTMTVPETYIRSAAFMTMAQFLKDSGRFKNEMDIFREAERRTNVAMVDYASQERPMIFDKLGFIGNFLNTLQTYAWNFYNQYSYFVREAKKGNVAPLLTALGVQYMIAGAMGLPGFEDAHKLYMALKDMLPARAWAKVQDNEFLREPKLWLLKNAGTDAVYGYLSDKSGVGIASRVAAPSAGQMLTSPAGPITDIAKQISSVGNAVMNPNQTTAAQAAMNVAPTGVQGMLETAPFMEGITYNQRPDGTKTYMRPTKLEDRSGLVNRTPQDETLRRLGMRSTKEVIERDVNYANKRDSDAAREKTTSLTNAFYDAVRRGNLNDAKDYYKTYVFINGQGISQEQFNKQIEQEFLTDWERSTTSPKKSIMALQNIKRAKDIFEQVSKDQK